jgi:hypothetical protein
MTNRHPERGSAMLVTLIIISALLAGAVVLVSMQLSSNRSTDLARNSMTALYCAEAGLQAARAVIATASKTDREAALAASAASIAANTTPTEPAFLLSGITSHDLDGDGVSDFFVYLRDNDDELGASPGSNVSALGVDVDSKVWLISTCTKYVETPKSVSELIEINDQKGMLYDWQAGGAMGNNNYNFQNTTY